MQQKDIKKAIIEKINSIDAFHDFKYYRDLKLGKMVFEGYYTVRRKDDYPDEEVRLKVNVCPFFFYDHNVSVTESENHFYKYGKWTRFFKDKVGRALIELNDKIADAMIQQRGKEVVIVFKYMNYWIWRIVPDSRLERLKSKLTHTKMQLILAEYPEYSIKFLLYQSDILIDWVDYFIFDKMGYPVNENDINWIARMNYRPSMMRAWRHGELRPW